MIRQNYKIIYEQSGIQVAETDPQIRTVRFHKKYYRLVMPYILWAKTTGSFGPYLVIGFRNFPVGEPPYNEQDWKCFFPMFPNVYTQLNVCLGDGFNMNIPLGEMITSFWTSRFTGNPESPDWTGEYLNWTSLKNIDNWVKLTAERPQDILDVKWCKPFDMIDACQELRKNGSGNGIHPQEIENDYTDEGEED